MQIIKLINNPISSNCYVVFNKNINNNCLVIDPGSESNDILNEIICKNELNPQYIILTHEHFDHCWGVNAMRQKYPNVLLICSKECSNLIQNKKKNLSVFYNQKGFEIQQADITIEELNYCLKWNAEKIRFIKTYGHSKGSVCINLEYDNILFSGDIMICGEKTITKLIGGDTAELEYSMNKLNSFFNQKNPLVYSGHGEFFYFNEYKN